MTWSLETTTRCTETKDDQTRRWADFGKLLPTPSLAPSFKLTREIFFAKRIWSALGPMEQRPFVLLINCINVRYST